MEYQKNFARKDCAELQDGDVLTRCNVSQEKAHTVLACSGKKITFRACNLHNVELWPEAVVETCYLVGLHKDVVEKTPPPVAEEARLRIKQLQDELGVDVVKDAAKVELELEAKTITEVIR